MVGILDCKIKSIFATLIICAMLAVPAAALQAIHPATEIVPGKALFLEHYLVANGTVISGKAPFRIVNFPTYWYNENTKQLNGKVDFAINDDLVMIFGDVLTLQGDFGEGTGNKLFGAYTLPITASQAYVYSLDASGNVAMTVNNEQVILRPGDSYTYTENETLQETNALIKVQYTHTYVNHGLIDKNKIMST